MSFFTSFWRARAVSSCSRVTVRGLLREVEIGPEGGFVPHPHSAAPVVADLSYRISLAKDIGPGTYSWPLSVSVRPL